MKNGDETAFIQLDQSKAYDVMDHYLLIEKMKLLGFNKKTIKIFTSYLNERKQYVSIDSFDSEVLTVRPQSVIQGSTLSCVLYFIFILDITQIFHNTKHNPLQHLQCSSRQINNTGCEQTNAKMYVDDNLIHTRPKDNQTLHQAVTTTFQKIIEYTNSNLLALNPENQIKSRIMIFSQDKDKKKEFSIRIGDKTLTHQKQLTILGNIINEELNWETHVKSKVIPDLTNRARSLKLIAICHSYFSWAN